MSLPVRLSNTEIRQAQRAGYMSVPVPEGRKASLFGAMFSWLTSINVGRALFWAGGSRSSPPVNSAVAGTGDTVTPSSALTVSAAWACVWLNARTIASLPLELKRYTNNKAELAENETLYRVLRWKSNRDMTAFSFWNAIWASEQLWGTGYAEKIRVGGRVVALEFLLPQYMTPYLTDAGELRFAYSEPLKPRDFASADIFRVFTRSLDGIVGASVIEFARNSLGLAQAGERAAATTFKKGLNASGFVGTEKFLTKEQRTTFATSIDEFTGSGPRAGGTMLLEGGATYTQLSMKPQDVELLNSRQFSVEDVCRWFSVPPILIGHASQGQTMWGSGVEQIFSGWARLSLRPFLTACTQEIAAGLIAPADRASLFAEYDLDDLLAADSQARAQLYASLLQNGVFNRDEVREREGKGPIPGGNLYTVQSNLILLEAIGKMTEQGGTSPPAEKLKNALIEFLQLAASAQPAEARKEKP